MKIRAAVHRLLKLHDSGEAPRFREPRTASYHWPDAAGPQDVRCERIEPGTLTRCDLADGHRDNHVAYWSADKMTGISWPAARH